MPSRDERVFCLIHKTMFCGAGDQTKTHNTYKQLAS